MSKLNEYRCDHQFPMWLLNWSRLEFIVVSSYRTQFRVRYADEAFDVIEGTHLSWTVSTKTSSCNRRREFKSNTISGNFDSPSQQWRTFDEYLQKKTINMDRILRFDSNNPMADKIICLKSLFSRISTQCSSPNSKKRKLYNIFQANECAINFMRRYTQDQNSRFHSIQISSASLRPALTRCIWHKPEPHAR